MAWCINFSYKEYSFISSWFSIFFFVRLLHFCCWAETKTETQTGHTAWGNNFIFTPEAHRKGRGRWLLWWWCWWWWGSQATAGKSVPQFNWKRFPSGLGVFPVCHAPPLPLPLPLLFCFYIFYFESSLRCCFSFIDWIDEMEICQFSPGTCAGLGWAVLPYIFVVLWVSRSRSWSQKSKSKYYSCLAVLTFSFFCFFCLFCVPRDKVGLKIEPGKSLR